MDQSFMQLIRDRRSARAFETRPVEREKLSLIVEAALRSPSSRSLNPWQFVVVQDGKTLEALSSVKPHGGGFLAKAPLAIAVVADPERCDVWVEDTAIAATYIQLAAESLGLKSCWCQIRLRDDGKGGMAAHRVREILAIPEALEVASVIGIGYPAEEKQGHLQSELDYGKVHDEGF
ncbi:nitroreductase family protein [Desulfoluna spongiiphila]|uniref:Nitroreductase n=1 Tax=Desulfoluna spongiiphila TaxID=419481 RepID=A0A1G5JHX8_9BACT|nr:nitroreductase family protein [Desulfoluna spongiiphila]SCY87328.1 Nitroreductase [Desulfoluna spongiiphila]VVS94843.1 nitroreductase [Desulfoluna spongiiphila]